MNGTIYNEKLTDFLKKHKINNFSEITYKCGAIKFVDVDLAFDHIKGKMWKTYKFHDAILNDNELYNWKYPYYVLFIPNKTYLMYEITTDKIIVWVCYTDEQERGKGYMSTLLKKLILLKKNKKIVIDTFNENLRSICMNLKQIELYR